MSKGNICTKDVHHIIKIIAKLLEKTEVAFSQCLQVFIFFIYLNWHSNSDTNDRSPPDHHDSEERDPKDAAYKRDREVLPSVLQEIRMHLLTHV